MTQIKRTSIRTVKDSYLTKKDDVNSSLNLNLFVNYYVDKDNDRQKEINKCFFLNLSNTEIKHIYVLIDREHISDFETLCSNYEFNNYTLLIQSKRPTYNDYFSFTRQYSKYDELSVIINSDIILPQETVKKLKNWHWNDNYCMALCRYEVSNESNLEDYFFNRPDSQDTWIVKGGFLHHDMCDFRLGIPGCDNRVAFCLNENYKVINPSKDLKTLHLHLSRIRHYYNERIERPYLILPPTVLN